MENLIRSWREVTPYFMLQVWKYAWDALSVLICQTLLLYFRSVQKYYKVDGIFLFVKLLQLLAGWVALDQKKLQSLFKGCWRPLKRSNMFTRTRGHACSKIKKKSQWGHSPVCACVCTQPCLPDEIRRAEVMCYNITEKSFTSSQSCWAPFVFQIHYLIKSWPRHLPKKKSNFLLQQRQEKK